MFLTLDNRKRSTSHSILYYALVKRGLSPYYEFFIVIEATIANTLMVLFAFLYFLFLFFFRIEGTVKQKAYILE